MRGSALAPVARALLSLLLVVSSSSLPACSRDDAKKPAQVDLASRFNRQPYPTAAAPPVDAAPPSDESLPWPSDIDAGAAAPSVAAASPTPLVAPEAGSPRPSTVNPDDAILERARMAAGACFRSLPAGPGFGPPERSAHIVFRVVPTGTVSRAEVSSEDTDDEAVLDCIKQGAQQTRFTNNGGGPLRTYEIDVRVFAPGSAGAH